jgi:hypothetical protein
MTMSPWSIRGRQNRETSRAQPGSGRPLCAEAAEARRRKGTASRNLVIFAFLPINARGQTWCRKRDSNPDPNITNAKDRLKSEFTQVLKCRIWRGSVIWFARDRALAAPLLLKPSCYFGVAKRSMMVSNLQSRIEASGWDGLCAW